MIVFLSILLSLLVCACWGKCDFKKVSLTKMSLEEMANQFDAAGVTWEEPVAVRGAQLVEDAWSGGIAGKRFLREDITRSEFRDSFGHIRLQPDCPSRFAFSCAANYSDYKEWVDNLKSNEARGDIIFSANVCSHDPECMSTLLATYGYPILHHRPHSIFLTAGTQSQGFVLHKQEEDMWMMGLTGVINWFVAPPSEEPPVPPYVVHYASTFSKNGFSTCTQRSNELVFVPAGWWRATYYSGDFTLGVGGLGSVSAAEYASMMSNAAWQASKAAMCTDNMLPPTWANLFCINVHTAARLGKVDVMEILESHGAALEMPSGGVYEWPKQPMHVAAEMGHLAIAEMLAERGADVTIREIKHLGGNQALHLAAKWGRADVVQLLIDRGAKMERNRAGDVPVHLAAEKGHEEIVRLLATGKASLLTKNNAGKTPVEIAHKAGHDAVVDVIASLRRPRAEEEAKLKKQKRKGKGKEPPRSRKEKMRNKQQDEEEEEDGENQYRSAQEERKAAEKEKRQLQNASVKNEILFYVFILFVLPMTAFCAWQCHKESQLDPEVKRKRIEAQKKRQRKEERKAKGSCVNEGAGGSSGKGGVSGGGHAGTD